MTRPLPPAAADQPEASPRAPRGQTSAAGHTAGIQKRAGVLLAVKQDRQHGLKVALVRWDGNTTATRISPKYIEPEGSRT